MTQVEIKQFIREALDENDLDAVVTLVQKKKRALSQLIRIAYDKDTLAGWRAIVAIGRVARTLLLSDYDFLRDTVRKLLWSLSDESGGIGWAAPEILGEIVSADPEKFQDIIPLIAEVYGIEEKVFRPGVVYALSRIAEVAPERVVKFQKIVAMSLVDKDSLVKVNALGLVQRLWRTGCDDKMWSPEYCSRISAAIHLMKKDTEVAWIYENNDFSDVQVGEKAGEVFEIGVKRKA